MAVPPATATSNSIKVNPFIFVFLFIYFCSYVLFIKFGAKFSPSFINAFDFAKNYHLFPKFPKIFLKLRAERNAWVAIKIGLANRRRISCVG